MKYVYVIENELGLIKVGVSSQPLKRKQQLSNASGLSCRIDSLLGPTDMALVVESTAHRLLGDYRMTGEWFKCDSDRAVSVCNTASKCAGLSMRMEKVECESSIARASTSGDVSLDEFIDNAFTIKPPTDIEKMQSSGGGYFVDDGEIFFCTPYEVNAIGSLSDECNSQRDWCDEHDEEYQGIDVVDFNANTITTYMSEKESHLHDLALEDQKNER